MTSNHIRSAVWFVLVACAIAFGPYIPLLKQFSIDLVAHPQPYLAIAIGMTVIGLGLFIVVGIVNALRSGRRMTEPEARAYASAALRVPSYAFYRGYFRGNAVGQQVVTSNSFRDIKEALRSGVWRHDPAWRRFLLMAAAALLWLYGAFAIAFVLGPPAIKLIVGAVLLYVTGRLTWSFWQA
jgi:hypothetical protein